ncbi:hypothetical protein GOP47_0021493 [Adiantum capillus-veneris]|uniref:Nuclear condensin complex subunit 3 C-terminal domain-containing protein n=1 Tax=Adiantum capillus-veneris TaxID=13818 RepID=A0A9D4U7I4_ADICA|nr:hypothetical protein GOP47_0021493 [Adiantum capillus-veneris]
MLNECQQSAGVHTRRAKELLAWRSQHKDGTFLTHLWKSLLPLFTIFKREPVAERLVKFVVTFVTLRDEKHGAECDAFLEEFFGLLLFSADSTNKAVRLRACQILSEIILRLNEDAEVSDDVWDNVIDSMQKRMQDKIPAIRVYSARALGRFASADDDPENDAILSTYRKSLQSDQNADVRRNIILFIPPSNATVHDIVRHTSDVNEAVRKAAFTVLSKKFPIQSLSIKQRTCILQRGLHDRRECVQAECLRMLKDVWLVKCCQGDAVALLKYLDVETNESVGESVMLALLTADALTPQNGQGLQKFVANTAVESEEDHELPHFLEAEEALYWRVFISYLHSEAQAKGHVAATTGGAQAAMNAAAATEKNELLDQVLPSTMTEYVQLVKAHMSAGPHLHFVARQLLLIGKHMDFSDAANRKIAGTFFRELICMPTGHLEEDNEVIPGDGLSLGGDKQWSKAIAELTWKVHEAPQEFATMVADVVAELSRPCREGGASVMQWINSLAAAGFLLENIKSLQQLIGCPIEAHELLGGLLLPAAKHIHPEIQRSAVRCLGMFCTREAKPSLQAVKQLRLAFLSGISPSQRMSSKALFDLCMWHGAQVLDRGISLCLTDDGDPKGDCGLPILDLLAQKLDIIDTEQEQVVGSEAGDGETLQGILAEGFAKLLLQSKVFSDIIPLQQAVLTKMLRSYFDEQTRSAPRLRQCLAVFFETYPSVSLQHKSCLAKSFVPLMRAEWPGIFGNESGAHTTAAMKRKHITKLSKFMLQMLHQPLFESVLPRSEASDSGEDLEQESPPLPKQQPKLVHDFDEELAVRIAAEVTGFPSQQRSAAARSYLAMLCKNICSLEFRQSEQELIKCLRKLLDNAKDTLMGDKQTIKDIDNLQARLMKLDNTPDDALSDEQLETILRNMEVEELKSPEDEEVEVKTPAPPPTRGRARRAKKASSPETDSSTSPVIARSLAKTPAPPTTARAARASKTAAMGKIRSDLVPSKRVIYGSSDENSASCSSDDGGKDSDDDSSESDAELSAA